MSFEVGAAVAVAVGVGLGGSPVGAAVGVGLGVGAAVGVAIGVGLGVGSPLGVAVDARLGFGSAVVVAFGIGLGVGAAVGVAVTVGLGVSAAVGFEVGVGLCGSPVGAAVGVDGREGVADGVAMRAPILCEASTAEGISILLWSLRISDSSTLSAEMTSPPLLFQTGSSITLADIEPLASATFVSIGVTIGFSTVLWPTTCVAPKFGLSPATAAGIGMATSR